MVSWVQGPDAGTGFVALGVELGKPLTAHVPNILPENRPSASWNIATPTRTALSCHHLHATDFLRQRSLSISDLLFRSLDLLLLNCKILEGKDKI